MNPSFFHCRRTAPILLWALLAAGSAWSQSTATKKELVAKAVQLQIPGIETLARGLVEQPASQMLREAGQVMEERLPANQREAAGKRIQESARKYVDEATPLLRDRAVKLAPAVLGASLEEKFTEEELKQLVAWLESPVSRKYQQAIPDIQSAFVQKLVADARPVIDPKLQALEQSIRAVLNPAASPSQSSSSSPRPSATKPPSAAASRPAGGQVVERRSQP